MSADSDLRDALPDPPPPRPDRRAMAIDTALQRFDGHEDRPRARRRFLSGVSLRAGFARPQLAAFATVILVGLVSLPLWLSDGDRFVQNSPQATATVAHRDGKPRSEAALAAHSAGLDIDVPPRSGPARATPPAGVLADNRDDTVAAEEASVAARSPDVQLAEAAMPAPDRPPAADRAADEANTAKQQRFALAPAPPAPAPVQAAPAAREGGRDIVVTGSRVADQAAASVAAVTSVASEPAAFGDWNACTIEDPRRDVRACTDLADPAAAGAAGRAAAHFADGLSLAWRGDLDRAIDAFGRAIRADPSLSIAYLNRGLAYRLQGDTERALADLDHAIAIDPEGARGYYHRSLLHRARGETALAEADARRAVQLDSRYEAALP